MSKEDGTPDPAGPSAKDTGQDIFAAVDGPDEPETPPASGGPEPTPGLEPSAQREVVPEVVATPAQTEPPLPGPAATVPAPASSPAQPTPSPVEPPVEPVPTLEEPSGQQPPLTQQQLAQFETEALEQLTKVYAIDAATLAEIEEKGLHSVLPRLLAKAQINALNSAMRLMQQQAPQMFRSMYMSETAKRAFTNKFFKSFPTLADKKHAPVVREILKRTRAIDPSMSMDDLIETVGSLASAKLKLPVQRSQGAGHPAAPASPSPAAFTPSASASRPAAAPKALPAAGQVNWAELVEEDT